jgi:hypothetical protein
MIVHRTKREVALRRFLASFFRRRPINSSRTRPAGRRGRRHLPRRSGGLFEPLEERRLLATIVDNGDAAFSTVGAWSLFTDQGFQGDVHAIAPQGGANTASWTFTVTPGQYRVSATWTTHANRATDAPFTILDGSTPLFTVREDQEQAPDDISDSGASFEDLGDIFSFTGTTLVVRLSDDANQYVIADAVRVDRVGDLPGAAEIQVLQGAAEVADGIGNNFSFGSTLPGVPVDKIFRVRNTGTASLTVQPVSVPAGFTVTSNIPADTVLASGAETTFTVRMTAASTGTFTGELSFANTDGDENPFNFTISGTVAATQIIDNGDAGFATIGSWLPFTGQGLNNDVQYATGGGGSQIASWTFAVTPGQYQLAITWSPDPNRATDAPYSIVQGPHTLFAEDVNQESTPNDFTDAGVGWRNLGGTLNLAGGTVVVRLTDDANQYVIADGVRLQRIGDLPAVQVVDDGDARVDVVGAWALFTDQGLQGDVRAIAAGGGANTVSWTFPVTPGQYRVSATWTTHQNRATDAPFTILDGTTVLSTVLKDQEQAPDDLNESGVLWDHLGGTINVTSGTLTVRLSDAANQYVIADGIRLERLGDLPAAAEIQVFQDDTEVTDGGSFSFPSTFPGLQVDKVFRVRNTGTTSLTVQPVSAPSGFTVIGNIPADTVLASGAETTFTVRMTAASTGTFTGDVSFANTDGNENPFNFEISGTVAAARIIDNGDEGFSTVGAWLPFAGQGFNNDVQYAAGGGGSQIATWSFPVSAGQYQVAVTWTTHENRATNAPYTVSQGAMTLVSESVDQEQAPNDFTDMGVGWRNLGGTLNLSAGTLVVRLTDNANQYVIADAVRLLRIGDPPEPPGGSALGEASSGTMFVAASTSESIAEPETVAGTSQDLAGDALIEVRLGATFLQSGDATLNVQLATVTDEDTFGTVQVQPVADTTSSPPAEESLLDTAPESDRPDDELADLDQIVDLLSAPASETEIVDAALALEAGS